MPTRRTVLAAGAGGVLACGLAQAGPTTTASAVGAADDPALPGATITDLGSPMRSLTVVEGAFATLADGRLAAFAPAQGENSELNVSTVVDATPVQVGRHPMTGAGGGPSITVAPDQSVYVGTYNAGHLFRWHPGTSTVTDVGTPTSPSTFLYGLCTAPDGTVYGGTYPDAKLWSYHPDRGFTDLGKVTDDPAITYVRSVAYDADAHALYAGTQPQPRLYRKDLAAGTVTAVTPAAPLTGTGITDLDWFDGHLFVANNLQFRVFDTTTDTEVDVVNGATGAVTRTFSITGRGTSSVRAGKVWFSGTGPSGPTLASYDLATRTASFTRHPLGGALIGLHWTAQDDHDVLYAFAGNYGAGAVRFDLQADTATRITLAISPAPSPLGNIVVSPDGSTVAINAFLNGNGVKRDVATGTITPIARLGQTEDWTWVEHGDVATLYAGTYPSGSLKQYRLDQPDSATNPRTLVELKGEPYRQIRPDDVQVRQGRLWAASEPDYGLRGGAITTVDLADGTVTVTRPVVADHTICSLAFDGDRVFAGSSRDGGTGTSPVAGSAVLVEFDPDARTVLHTLTPVAAARSITALLVHDGRLLGLADTTVFEVDLTSFTTTRTFALPGLGGGTGPGGGDLVLHPNGYLYAQAQESLLVVDPLSLGAASTLATRVRRAALSADRSLWCLKRPDGFSEPLHHVQVVPNGVAEPDVRWRVHVGEVTTEVVNRFVETGRTLADVVAEAYSSDHADARARAELARLVTSGTITPGEHRMIARAAR